MYCDVRRCDLTFPSYDKPPLDDITLDEFETFAIDRLRILSEIEASYVRNRSYDELKAIVKAQQAKYMTMTASSDQKEAVRKTEVERRKDHISHFVLRLAFCRSYVFGFRFGEFSLLHDLQGRVAKAFRQGGNITFSCAIRYGTQR